MTKFGALAFSILMFATILLTGSTPAFAATQSKGVSITTSPVSAELVTAPGTTTSTTLQVMNNSTAPLSITLSLQTFVPYGTDGRAQITKPKASDQFINWVTFSKNNFIAQPNVWNQVKMTIDVPSYAALGYYYAVMVKPNVVAQSGPHTDTLKSSNAILVLLNAQSPNEHPEISLSSFTSVHGIYEYLPATFNINVHNSGNIYLSPTGNIFISKSSTNFSSNNLLGTIGVNNSGGNVLPNSNRIFTAQWTNGFPVFTPKTLGGQPITDNQGNTIYQLKWNYGQSNKFRFGKYYAKLVLVYNNGQREVPITAIVSFWVIPWKLMLLGLLIIVIIVGLIVAAIYYSHKSKKGKKWRA